MGIAFVAEKFVGDILSHGVAGGKCEGQKIATVIDDQMQLKAIKPSPGGLATSSDAVKNTMAVDPFVVANFSSKAVESIKRIPVMGPKQDQTR